MKSKLLAVSAISASLTAIILTIGAYVSMADLFCLTISSVTVLPPLYFKSYKAGFLSFLIAVIKVAEGVNTTYLGAIVGYPLSNNNNSINNCQAIVISGQQLNVYTSKHNTYPPKIVNTAVYTSIEAFYANVNRTNYTFALWHFEEGFYPYLGNEMQIAVEEEAVEVPAGQSVAVKVNNVMAYTVSSNVEGVSYANGQVVVADSVEAGTEATLTFTCLYTGNTATITIMVTANS
jgi:hypothetical protein